MTWKVLKRLHDKCDGTILELRVNRMKTKKGQPNFEVRKWSKNS